ncbi:MAG: mannose-1-phosphate guanyltransferase [Anaerolineae bacterium]|nr:MAG: mannose-1-phosphate guanyltransferase [Anaerolineae bacterium]
MNEHYEHFYAVIMAGGGGTRLWPLSRQSRPKQMIPITGSRSLFQIAVDRLEGLFPAERILVVTTADQAPLLQQQCPQIPAANYLLEPLPRGTASVVGLAAVALQQRDPQAVMAVLTADHIFKNEALFRDLLRAAHQAALQDHLVTLGITPTFPATGYGYIQRGEPLGEHAGFPTFRVRRFVEKPPLEKARAMLKSGDYAWNSGMFVWKVERILAEFALQMPTLHGQLQQIAAAYAAGDPHQSIEQIWPQIKPQTIDYGVMENARDVVVIPAGELGWNDVGSWEALFDVLSPSDEAGNIVLNSEHLGLETQKTLIYQSEASKRLIVTIGVEGLVVVDMDDVLLVCRKEDAQKVRQIVKTLKEQGRAEI